MKEWINAHWVQLNDAKPIGDVAALAALAGTLANWLPQIAAGVSIVWGMLRCYDAYLEIQRKRKELNDGKDHGE